MQNRINEYGDLLKSKENEYKMRETHDGQRLKDEIQSMDEYYKE